MPLADGLFQTDDCFIEEFVAVALGVGAGEFVEIGLGDGVTCRARLAIPQDGLLQVAVLHAQRLGRPVKVGELTHRLHVARFGGGDQLRAGRVAERILRGDRRAHQLQSLQQARLDERIPLGLTSTSAIVLSDFRSATRPTFGRAPQIVPSGPYRPLGQNRELLMSAWEQERRCRFHNSAQ